MDELEKASGRRLCDTGTSRGSRSSSHAFSGYLGVPGFSDCIARVIQHQYAMDGCACNWQAAVTEAELHQ